MSRLLAWRADRERGSATLELVILMPAVLLLLGLIVVAGRVEVASGAVEHAAAAAAREASLARTPEGARAAALVATADSLQGQDLRCVSQSVVLDVSGFARQAGQPAQVTATVTCTLGFDDLAIAGLPGSRTLSAQSSSVLDRFRSRTLGFGISDGFYGVNSGVVR